MLNEPVNREAAKQIFQEQQPGRITSEKILECKLILNPELKFVDLGRELGSAGRIAKIFEAFLIPEPLKQKAIDKAVKMADMGWNRYLYPKICAAIYASCTTLGIPIMQKDIEKVTGVPVSEINRAIFRFKEWKATVPFEVRDKLYKNYIKRYCFELELDEATQRRALRSLERMKGIFNSSRPPLMISTAIFLAEQGIRDLDAEMRSISSKVGLSFVSMQNGVRLARKEIDLPKIRNE